jgi:hypothetical protein
VLCYDLSRFITEFDLQRKDQLANSEKNLPFWAGIFSFRILYIFLRLFGTVGKSIFTHILLVLLKEFWIGRWGPTKIPFFWGVAGSPFQLADMAAACQLLGRRPSSALLLLLLISFSELVLGMVCSVFLLT